MIGSAASSPTRPGTRSFRSRSSVGVLGELNLEIDVPEAIDVLEIPAGPIDLQRLFYWHVCKMFYRPAS